MMRFFTGNSARFISLLCILALLMAGCSGGSKSPDPASPGPESSGSESPDPASSGPESPDPESPDSEFPDPESPDPESPDPAESKDDMSNMLWWQKTNAYEIYANSFQDSDGDGYGDLNGIRSRLDHLKSLGVGAVWLTPVYESPMMDNGYDVADYYAINPRYGTMEDMEALIKEADEKGIRIVMDLVFNHTSDQNQWFLESRKGRDNDYSYWYIWRDPKEDGSEPNNWRSIFGGSA